MTFFINLFLVRAGLTRRGHMYIWAAAVLFCSLFLWQKGAAQWKMLSIEWMLEGMLAGLVLFVCYKKRARVGQYLLWGLIPTIAYIAVVFGVPFFRDHIREGITATINMQTVYFEKLGLADTGLSSERAAKIIFSLMPSLWLCSGLIRLWFVTLLLRLTLKKSGVRFPAVRFNRFEVPDAVLWVFIAGLALEIFGSGVYTVAGHNALAFSLFLYCVQGVAVLQRFFAFRQVSKFMIIIFYATVLMLKIPVAFICLLGLADTWFYFRKKMITVTPKIST